MSYLRFVLQVNALNKHGDLRSKMCELYSKFSPTEIGDPRGYVFRWYNRKPLPVHFTRFCLLQNSRKLLPILSGN